MESASLRSEHAADTRRALVAAARRLFSQRGYSATSLDDVCGRARLTKGALYHHFRSKRELFAAALEQLQQEHVRAGASAGEPGTDLWEQLRLAGRAFVDACARSSARRIVQEAPAVLGWKRCREIEAGHVVRLLRTALEQAAARGLLRSDHPEILAQLLVALFDEAGMIVAAARDPAAARVAVAQQLDSLIGGLRSPQPAALDRG